MCVSRHQGNADVNTPKVLKELELDVHQSGSHCEVLGLDEQICWCRKGFCMNTSMLAALLGAGRNEVLGSDA